MTFDIGEETCSSLDGNESPRHNQHKLQKRGMKRKERDSEPGSTEGSQESQAGVEQGHEWNDQFGFKIERPAKAQYEWMQERINVCNALLFSSTPAAPQLMFKGRSYKEAVEICVRRAGEIDEEGNGTIEAAWWEVKCAPGLGQNILRLHG